MAVEQWHERRGEEPPRQGPRHARIVVVLYMHIERQDLECRQRVCAQDRDSGSAHHRSRRPGRMAGIWSCQQGDEHAELRNLRCMYAAKRIPDGEQWQGQDRQRTGHHEMGEVFLQQQAHGAHGREHQQHERALLTLARDAQRSHWRQEYDHAHADGFEHRPDKSHAVADQLVAMRSRLKLRIADAEDDQDAEDGQAADDVGAAA